jgi:hypothetical protein
MVSWKIVMNTPKNVPAAIALDVECLGLRPMSCSASNGTVEEEHDDRDRGERGSRYLDLGG